VKFDLLETLRRFGLIHLQGGSSLADSQFRVRLEWIGIRSGQMYLFSNIVLAWSGNLDECVFLPWCCFQNDMLATSV
jgi:hypothetical protein